MQFCAMMVFPPPVIISFGVIQINVALLLFLENLSQMAIHAVCKEQAVPQSKSTYWTWEVTLPPGLTHHTAWVLLEETRDRLLCDIAFQGELLASLRVQNSNLKENKHDVRF